METGKIVQAVILMVILAMAASCATSNQYVSKLFGPRPALQKDSLQTVRFLELDSLDNQEGWVKTDTIKIRKDSSAETTGPVTEDPVAKTNESRLPVAQGTRSKRTRE